MISAFPSTNPPTPHPTSGLRSREAETDPTPGLVLYAIPIGKASGMNPRNQSNASSNDATAILLLQTQEKGQCAAWEPRTRELKGRESGVQGHL